MLGKRNSADGRGDTDDNKDTGVAPAAATAGPGEDKVAEEASRLQVSALNSPRDGFGDEKRIEVGNETRSPSPSPSDSDYDAHRGGDDKGSGGIIGSVVRVFTWTPKKLRYDPKNPPQFTLAHNFLYAVVSFQKSDTKKRAVVLRNTGGNFYRGQPLLQSAGIKQDCGNVRRQFREGVVRRDADAGWVCRGTAPDLSAG